LTGGQESFSDLPQHLPRLVGRFRRNGALYLSHSLPFAMQRCSDFSGFCWKLSLQLVADFVSSKV